MGQPQLENRTPFAFGPLFLADEEGRPVVVPLVKATFDILAGGGIEFSEEQVPLDFGGTYHGEPGQSSYRYEPEVAWIKPATDVVLVGHAHAASRSAIEVDVEFRVGTVGRRLRVSGDREWTKRLFGSAPSAPKPFEKIPLVYERAFGGWDRSDEDRDNHSFHAGNPVGVGYRRKRSRFEEGAPLPNIEAPDALLESYHGKSEAAGFGFTCPQWEPRRLLAGTYDDAWTRGRMPLLPRDFDRRFFNAASPGLVAAGYLRGDEPVRVRGASPEGVLSFRLPGVAAPNCRISLRYGADRTVPTKLDTVIVDLDSRKLLLLWRAHTQLRTGPHDVRAIEVTTEYEAPKRAVAPLPQNVLRLSSRGGA